MPRGGGGIMNNTSLYIQFGFILHLLGDYIFQNSWMANQKTKSFFPAMLHATIYSLPFSFLVHAKGLLIILITHFFIDRYRLASYWIKLVNWNFSSKNHGFTEATPIWLSTWLLFIIDNIFHIVINTLSIIYFIK
jgi:hypothetical protein